MTNKTDLLIKIRDSFLFADDDGGIGVSDAIPEDIFSEICSAIKAERAKPVKTVTLKEIPVPPSTNTLFRNVAGKGRVRTERYKTWAQAAGWMINLQRPEKVCGPVTLDITMQRPRLNADLSNRIKGLEDLLVTMGVIDDDKHVQAISIRWGDVNGCLVVISSVEVL